MKHIINTIAIVVTIAIFAIVGTSFAGGLDKNPNHNGNGYAYAYGKNKKADKVRNQILQILKKEKISLATVGLSEKASVTECQAARAYVEAELAVVEDQLAECQIGAVDEKVDSMFSVVEETPAPVADTRKFAISKLNGEKPGIYTNHWALDDETASKLESMDAGIFRIQVIITDMETGTSVEIESTTEGFDWNKDGYDWFIGQTIFG